MLAISEVLYTDTLPTLVFPAVATAAATVATTATMACGTNGRARMVCRRCVVLACRWMIWSGRDVPMLGHSAAAMIVLVAICIRCTRIVGMLILHVPAELSSVFLARMVPVARMLVPVC
jgi:hypothetical protein